MREKTRTRLFAACIALMIGTCAAQAQDRIPSVKLPPAQITLDIPLPVSGDLTLLLAQSGQGGGLSALKEEAVRQHRGHLLRELSLQLHRLFERERVPVAEQGGELSLHKTLDIAAFKHLTQMQSRRGYDLERGNVELRGSFHYRLQNASGSRLREQHIDLAELQVREPYEVKSWKNRNETEDDSEQAIERALSEMVQRLLKRIEGDLSADQLRRMTAG